MKGQLANYITYETSPTYDVALLQTGRQQTIRQFRSQDFEISGYHAVIASYYAAVHGETPKAYVELLILKDMAEHEAMAEKPYQCSKCHWLSWFCDAELARDKDYFALMPCGHSWQHLEHADDEELG